MMGCSGGIDCSKQACPNDPPPDNGTITRCDKQLSSCGKVCDAYLSCMDSNKSKTCGGDGKTDANLYAQVKMSCNASPVCAQCLLAIP
jgi:hypothetical protein